MEEITVEVLVKQPLIRLPLQLPDDDAVHVPSAPFRQNAKKGAKKGETFVYPTTGYDGRIFLSKSSFTFHMQQRPQATRTKK